MLSDEYRPTDFADYVGQDDVVARIKFAIDRNVRKGKPVVLWVSGSSGVGKTSIAGLLAKYVGCAEIGIDDRNGGHIGAKEVLDIRDSLQLSALQGDWKACVIEESHLMTQTAVSDFLDVLEKLYPRRIVIFTSTKDIEDGELFKDENVPFRRRCLCYKLQPVSGAAAIARIEAIARAEEIPLPDSGAAERLLSACQGNLGEALSRLEAGNIPPVVDTSSKPKSRFDSIKFAA